MALQGLDTERRQQIIEACCRAICQQGMADISLRTIAAEMQATTGLITRYFLSKEALLLAVLETVCGALLHRVQLAGAGHSGLALVRAGIVAALPATAQAQANWQVWAAFIGILPGAEKLAQAHHHFPAQLRQSLIKGLREAQISGQVAATLYPPQAADILVDQIIGASVRRLSDLAGYPAEKLMGVMAQLLDSLIARR